MTRFYYTPDMQDTVTEALGKGWHRLQDGLWDRFIGCQELYCQVSDHDGHLRIKVEIEGGTYSSTGFREVAALAPIIEAAIDRLRAAGLKEVDE